MKTLPIYLALALAAASAGVAQQPPRPPQPAQGPQQPQPPQPPQPPDDPIGRNLFAPELIMRYGHDIGLAPEQRATITKAIQEFQLAVRAEPSSTEANNLLRLVFAKRKNVAGTIAGFRKTIKLEPQNAAARRPDSISPAA